MMKRFFYHNHRVLVVPTAAVSPLLVDYISTLTTIIVILVILGLLEWNKKKFEEKELKKQKTLADRNRYFCREMVESLLEKASKRLRWEEQERISVYLLLRDDDNHFELVARYSEHPIHSLPSSREKYDFRHAKKGTLIGVLGKVWGETGYYADNQFPDFSKNGGKDWKNYVRSTYKLTQKTIDSFRMHPREIFAHIIRSKQKNP
ncbi:MAG: hypothetical protein GDA50_03040 [Alphaproteobacteria bacterium GM202ARS2]|nr:hypothetical protein [Alphaproteobacteria bacterium GM202ARS2]